MLLLDCHRGSWVEIRLEHYLLNGLIRCLEVSLREDLVLHDAQVCILDEIFCSAAEQVSHLKQRVVHWCLALLTHLLDELELTCV